MSSFGVGALVGTFLGGKFTDRLGYYPVMFWTLFLQGFMFILLLQAESYAMVMITIFLTSAIGEAFRPANFVAISAYSMPENRTRALGLQRLAINLGMAIGPAIGGLIAVKSGYSWLFIIDGLTCIVAALIFRGSLKPQKLAPKEQQSIEAKGDGSPYRDVRYLFFLILVLMNAMAFFQLFTTLPVFFREHVHLLENHIGQLMAFNCLLIVIFEMPLIYGVEGKIPMLKVTGFGAFLVGLSFVSFNLFGWTFGIAILAMFILTFGEILTLPFLSSIAMERSNRGNRGAYMGLYTMTYSLAHILAPFVGMQVANLWGFGTLWYVIGGLSVLTYTGLLLMVRKKR